MLINISGYWINPDHITRVDFESGRGVYVTLSIKERLVLSGFKNVDDAAKEINEKTNAIKRI